MLSLSLCVEFRTSQSFNQEIRLWKRERSDIKMSRGYCCNIDDVVQHEQSNALLRRLTASDAPRRKTRPPENKSPHGGKRARLRAQSRGSREGDVKAKLLPSPRHQQQSILWTDGTDHTMWVRTIAVQASVVLPTVVISPQHTGTCIPAFIRCKRDAGYGSARWRCRLGQRYRPEALRRSRFQGKTSNVYYAAVAPAVSCGSSVFGIRNCDGAWSTYAGFLLY